jgi:ribonuclease P protein subunit RPR2
VLSRFWFSASPNPLRQKSQPTPLTMGKAKTSKGSNGSQNTLQHARISYLHRVAVHLSEAIESAESTASAPILNKEHNEAPKTTNAQSSTGGIQSLEATSFISKGLDHKEHDQPSSHIPTHTFHPYHRLPRRFLHDIRAISLKSQIRLPQSVKRSICKRCDGLLIQGITSTETSENRSRKHKKPWAETLVQSCNSCGAERRFPVGARKQTRRSKRDANSNLAPRGIRVHDDGIGGTQAAAESDTQPTESNNFRKPSRPC